MTYVQIDDTFPDNPNIEGLSDAAFRLYVSAVCYCGRHLTDGFITEARVSRLVPRYKKSALAELLTTGRFERAVGGYQVHDYLKHQRSREQVEKEKAAAKVRAHEHRTRTRTNAEGADPTKGHQGQRSKSLMSPTEKCPTHGLALRADGRCAGCAADEKAAS